MAHPNLPVPSQRGGLSVFDYTDGNQIRTSLDEAGDPWFVAADVCSILALGDVSKALTRVDEADTNSVRVSSGGQMRNVRTVNEPGLYELIFRSDKEEAKAFRRWVTHEVLPSIRKTGAYVDPRASDEQLAAVVDLAQKRLLVLQSASGLVDPSWLEAKTRHQVAIALGEEPELDPATRPLTVGEYLEGKGVTGAAQRSLSSTFGKRLAKRYRSARGKSPLSTERFVDGGLRAVNGYIETDRELFDQVWAELNATEA